jgi:hypothetical protein
MPYSPNRAIINTYAPMKKVWAEKTKVRGASGWK